MRKRRANPPPEVDSAEIALVIPSYFLSGNDQGRLGSGVGPRFVDEMPEYHKVDWLIDVCNMNVHKGQYLILWNWMTIPI